MDERLLSLLERLVIAQESIAASMKAGAAYAAPAAPQSAPVIDSMPEPSVAREKLMEAHDGELVTVSQVRAALGVHNASNRAIGTLMATAGFKTHRIAAGIRYVIGEPASGKAGHPVVMPSNMDALIVEARKYPHSMVSSVFLSHCLRQEGKNARFTQAHIDELHRRYPGEFRDNMGSLTPGIK